MSKEKKDDFNEAPPVGETQEEEQLIKDFFSLCPENALLLLKYYQ